MSEANAEAVGGKLTKAEKSWILYDVGNSAFTMMVSTIIPIYLNVLGSQSSADYLAMWSYAVSISTLISAVSGLIFGGMADHKGWKKPLFALIVLGGAVACGMLGFAQSWQVYLALFVVAKILYSNSLVLYDSMLIDVTTDQRMDKVSANGYAWGYIGSCVPFGAALVLCLMYESIGITLQTAMEISFLIIAFWWAGMTIPLYRNYTQRHFAEAGGHPVKDSFIRLGNTFRKAKSQKHIFVFLLAFFFFIDGVYTIIDEATAYGTSLGLDSTNLLIALLVTQFVAAPFSVMFGRWAQKYKVENLIKICILAYFGIALYAITLNTIPEFWLLAVCVGMFQGGIQSLSRSYYARLIPPEQSGEYFGLYDICGKGASFIGTTIVGIVSQATGKVNYGVGAIASIFFIGFLLFLWAEKLVAQYHSQGESPMQ